MSPFKSGQMIQPSPALRAKVGGAARMGALDPAIIAKAEAALAGLSDNFAEWLNDEIAKLEAARQEIRSGGVTAESMERLYLRAHDLKGLGATYGFPFITRIAGLLCRLIDDKSKRLGAPMHLIDAHIDTIKAAVRDNIKADDHPVGQALVRELEALVREFGA